MLVGAHVSPAGGPARAVDRGVERGAESIQFFNQSPRAWRAREYTEEEAAEFRETLEASSVQAAVIHAVYLINCASRDRTIRRKSLNALTIALRSGAALGRRAASCCTPARPSPGDVKRAVTRAGKVIRGGAGRLRGLPAAPRGHRRGRAARSGRSFSELAALIEAAGGDERLGLCLDSCHLYASGYDVRTAEGLRDVIDECVEDRRPRASRLGARQRQQDRPGVQRRPPRAARRGRAGRKRLRRVPVRTAVRRPAGDLRGPRASRARRRPRPTSTR